MVLKKPSWLRWPSWLNQKRATGTWIGHGLVVAGFFIVGAVLGAFFGSSPVGALFATIAGALFFIAREEINEWQHRLAGDYDKPQEGGGATSREDKVGDLTGPIAFASGTVLMFLVCLLAWRF